MPDSPYSTVTRTRPTFMADQLGREHLALFPAKLDPAAFPTSVAVTATVAAGGAAIGATTVPVAALSGPIPATTILDFGGSKFARLTADAASGATSVGVTPLPLALDAADAATYPGTGHRTIEGGTLVGRTYAERDAGANFGPATVASDDEQYLTAFDVADADKDASAVLLEHEYRVKENYLPNWANLPTATKTKIRALYNCLVGQD